MPAYQPMDPFHLAAQTIEKGIRSGQIGTPVAVRIVAHLTADHGTVGPLAGQALAAAAGWLQSDPTWLFSSGSIQEGQISTLVRFAAGQSALVSAGTSGVGSPQLMILVVGQRGMLAWQPDAQHTQFAIATNGGEHVAAMQAGQWAAWITRSLESRRAVRLAELPGAVSSDKGSVPDPNPAPWPKASPIRRAQQPPYGALLVAGDYTHQPSYASALASDKRCRLIAMTDEADVTPRRRKLNEQLARQLNIPVLPDLETALSRKDIHIVSLCAEPARRGRIAIQAANAGKHLYLDKPLAASYAEAQQIDAAVQQAGVVGHMFSLVHAPVVARIRHLLDSKQLGELVAIHCDMSFAKGPAGTARLGQPRQESAAPGQFELADSKRELTNVGVYPLVMMLSLLKRRIRTVFAATGNYFFAEHQQNDMEDFGQVLLQFDGGITASVSVGRTGWRSSPGGGLNRTVLVGSQATAVVDAYDPRVEVWADTIPWTAPPRNPHDPMGMWHAPKSGPYQVRPKQSWYLPAGAVETSDAGHFLDCIESGRQSRVSVAVAAMATEALMAAYRSAATGHVVTL